MAVGRFILQEERRGDKMLTENIQQAQKSFAWKSGMIIFGFIALFIGSLMFIFGGGI